MPQMIIACITKPTAKYEFERVWSRESDLDLALAAAITGSLDVSFTLFRTGARAANARSPGSGFVELTKFDKSLATTAASVSDAEVPGRTRRSTSIQPSLA